MLIRLSAPSGLAVPLDDLKVAIRVDTSLDDNRLKDLIRSETRRYEDFTGRIMLPTEFEYRVDGWDMPLRIPAFPIREVTEVAYLDEDNVEQTVAAVDWYAITYSDGEAIAFSDGVSPPALSSRAHAVQVRFLAGYDEPDVSGSGDDPELAWDANDRRNIVMMVRKIYDTDAPLTDDELRMFASNRRIFK